MLNNPLQSRMALSWSLFFYGGNRMYFLYIDESGVQELNAGPNHFVLAGIAIPSETWKEKELEIEKTKKYYNLQDVEIHTAWMLRKYIEQGITPDFKMMNYEERIKFVESERKKRLLYISATNTSNKLKSIKKEYRKTKKYIHLTIEERNEFISEIARAISNWYDSFTFAYCIDKSAFGMEPPKYPPYEEAFMMITTSFQRFLEEKNEQGLIIQDNNENMKRRLHSLSKFFHKKGTLFTKLNNIVETPLFVDSEITTMIQIADIVSYGIRRYLDNNENNIFSYIYRRAYWSAGKQQSIVHYTGQKDCHCKICIDHR